MELLEVKDARSAEEAARIFRKTNPKENISGDVFVSSKGCCYGVILPNEINKGKSIVNFYAVTRATHLHDWIAYYQEKIISFEKKHPNTKVVLAVGGVRSFYVFITIRGEVKKITDEDVKKSFNLCLIDRR